MIDLRSDTFTQPTPAMRDAMMAAPLGDDVYGEDPTVNELEAHVSQLLGKAAAVYVASGTQSNLCGILAHCQRGDEYLVGQTAHAYRYEAGGAAVLGSIQPQPIEVQPDGTLDLADIDRYVKRKPNMDHFAHSKLLCLENTNDGRVLPPGYVAEAQALARSHGLKVHLDGARLWNAAVATGVEPAAIADGFDTVSVCLSKGLGAPVGSVLVGSEDLIEEARRWRKMLGGAMRQAGVIAAAGLHAVKHHVDRLADDHTNAQKLAAGLADVRGVTVEASATNMAFVSLDDADPQAVCEALEAQNVKVSPGSPIRLVCHLGVAHDDIDRVISSFRTVLG